jgi:hypothetical protein
MALVLKDRVKETTTTTGTGSFSLAGAVTGYDSFGQIGSGNTTYYAVYLDGGSEWEVGIGTYTSPSTLSRDTILASSNSGSVVTFSAGQKTIWCDYPAGAAVYASNNGSQTSGQVLKSNGVGTPPTWQTTTNGDVVGPASATDNAVARFDQTTGKLIQNSLVIVDDTGSVTGVNALTAESLTVNNNATFGTSNSDTINFVGRINSDFDPATDNTYDLGRVGHEWRNLYIDGTANIDSLIADTADINAGTIDNTTIGATTPQNGSFVNLSVTGTTSFDGQEGTAGQVLTSAGSGNTPTWTTPTTGTVTSVAALTLGTTGTDLSSTVANGTTTPVITLQVPTASATNRGALSSTDWSTFNGKANAFTYTTNYIPYGQGTTTPNQSANLTYDGTTLKAQAVNATNGIVVNSKTVSANYTIASGDNAMSSGPVTLSNGVTVTVSSGSRWVVL